MTSFVPSVSRIDCEVCCESVIIIVTCPYCKYNSCLVCFDKFLQTCKDVVPTCMNCNKNLSTSFLYRTSVKLYNNFQEYRASLIFNREKGLLPQSQEKAKKMKTVEEFKNMDKELADQIREYQQKINELRECRAELSLEIKRLQDPNDVKAQDKAKKFQGLCPYPDCKGTILYSTEHRKYFCGLCDKIVCRTCRQIYHNGDCKEEDIQLAKIMLECKQCPGCQVPVNKISGCPQIFCTCCRVFFDWDTLQITNPEHKHNPDYIEMKNRLGDVVDRPLADHCGNVDYDSFRRKFRHLLKPEDYKMLEQAFILRGHIEDNVLPKYQAEEYNIQTYEAYRIKYLTNETDDSKWAAYIKKKEKEREKKREYYNVLRSFSDLSREIFNSMYESTHWPDFAKFVIQIPELREYTNECFSNLKKIFKNEVPVITNDWKIIVPGERRKKE